MRLSSERLSEIRDPIHNSVTIDHRERKVIDHPFVQRLRGIRQLGFAHLPFPGATHTRFGHSIGVCHLAGIAFDSIFSDQPFGTRQRYLELRYCVRLAALLHDIGHGPFSHAAEFAMPDCSELVLPPGMSDSRRASHEDYTVSILLSSSLSVLINTEFPFTAEHVAALIDPSISVGDDFFWEQGIDLRCICSQLVSSNLDMDRLDYLVRDSYYAGVKYGQIDVAWLMSHLCRHIDIDGRLVLAVDRRATYALDDFLISRYHMFLMVYFHRKSVGYELMFREYMRSPECSYRIPASLEEYQWVDDAQLLCFMRNDDHPYAQRIIKRNPYKVAFERHGHPEEVDLYVRKGALEEAGVSVIADTCIGIICAKPKPGKAPIYLISREQDNTTAVPLHNLSSAFAKSRFEACISRLYVPPESLTKAKAVLADLDQVPEQQRLL